jgi:cyclopropane fatty-acyl-phospholipid synthase-like methyltransferase
MAGNETGRNPRWQDWYPTVRPDFGKLGLDKSPYGEVNQETLALFGSLPKGSTVLDVGGGDGRFALPLAAMGLNVFVTDIDLPHLQRIQEKKVLLPENAGQIIPILSDATTDFPIKDGSVDAVLNAGFGYLVPPEQLTPFFGKMTKALKPDGLMVFEFATNRERKASKDSEDSLIGPTEYRYSFDEGMETLMGLYDLYGFRDVGKQTKTIHFEEPYYMHNDLIIAHGTK